MEKLMEWLCKEEPYPRYECSNCGYSFTTVNRFSNERLYKFCPECGAKNMEGGTRHAAISLLQSNDKDGLSE